MIRVWYEISCDECGSAEHFGGSMKLARIQAKENGWIVIGKKYFCTKDCKQKYNGKRNLTPLH